MPQYTDFFQLTTATRSLHVAALYMGGCLTCLFWGHLADTYGRRTTMFWSALLTVIAAGLQGAAQNVAMFCTARIVVGMGTTSSAISAPAYLAEVLPWTQRAWGLTLLDDFFYVGAVTAAGVTYATAPLPSSWAWRLPSLLQGAWACASLALLPFVPESPRWLVDMGRHQEALRVLAHVNAGSGGGGGGDGGGVDDVLVRLQFCEICDTIGYERNPLPCDRMLRSRSARKRLLIAASCALAAMLQGHLLVQYEIGQVLAHVGLADRRAQLLVNMGLHATTLLVSLAGSGYTARRGAKPTALVSTGCLTVSLFVLGALTKTYGTDSTDSTGTGGSKSGMYATIAMIFVFSASYGFGWIPILFLVPAEQLNFSIRAWGMSMFNFVICLTGIWANFAVLYALERLKWKLYMINGSWNVLVFVFIAWYWVDFRGKTLEEIDELFDGTKHSSVPNVETARRELLRSG